MGFKLQQPWSHVESANEFVECMARGVEEAKAALTKAKEEYTQYYNHQRTPAPEFKPGDMVYLNEEDIKTTCPSAKLSHRNLGPYRVEKKVGATSYRLQLPPSLRRLYSMGLIRS